MFTEVISRTPTGFITTDYTIQTVCTQTLHLLALYGSEGKRTVRSCKLPHTEWLIPGSLDDASLKSRECTESNFYGRTEQGRTSGTVNRLAKMSSALRRVQRRYTYRTCIMSNWNSVCYHTRRIWILQLWIYASEIQKTKGKCLQSGCYIRSFIICGKPLYRQILLRWWNQES